MKKVLTIQERQLVIAGLFMGMGTIGAVLFVTNLPIYTAIPYGILCIISCLYTTHRFLDQSGYPMNVRKDTAIVVILCLMLIEKGIYIKDLSGSKDYIWEVNNVVKSGALQGIFCSYMGGYIKNTSEQEWSQYVHEGESILLVEEPVLGTSDYLRGNTRVAVPSTICTPTYSENLLKYWEIYPDKYPDVIAVSCWYGDLQVAIETWIMNWIETKYQPSTYADGTFWRFYRRFDEPLK
jgi:hypothetical protein